MKNESTFSLCIIKMRKILTFFVRRALSFLCRFLLHNSQFLVYILSNMFSYTHSSIINICTYKPQILEEHYFNYMMLINYFFPLKCCDFSQLWQICPPAQKNQNTQPIQEGHILLAANIRQVHSIHSVQSYRTNVYKLTYPDKDIFSPSSQPEL